MIDILVVFVLVVSKRYIECFRFQIRYHLLVCYNKNHSIHSARLLHHLIIPAFSEFLIPDILVVLYNSEILCTVNQVYSFSRQKYATPKTDKLYLLFRCQSLVASVGSSSHKICGMTAPSIVLPAMGHNINIFLFVIF